MSCSHGKFSFALAHGDPVVKCVDCGAVRPLGGKWDTVEPVSSIKKLESALFALASLDLNDVPYHLQEDLAHISHQAHAALEDIKKGSNHHD